MEIRLKQQQQQEATYTGNKHKHNTSNQINRHKQLETTIGDNTGNRDNQQPNIFRKQGTKEDRDIIPAQSITVLDLVQHQFCLPATSIN
jgi:hypothetical protein